MNDERTGAQAHSRTGMDRREALGAMGAMTFGLALPLRERYERLLQQGQQPVFFTDAERALVTVLADMIIPRDDKSGGATDSGALPYMEFVLSEDDARTQQAWHDGLAWFDAEANRRFQKPFAQADETQRGQVLDDIAFPARAADAFKTQAQFFNRVRDLVAAAFFSSKMGVEDLGYAGNRYNVDWQGAPPEALAQLQVSYAEWDAKYGQRAQRQGRTGAPTHRSHE